MRTTDNEFRDNIGIPAALPPVAQVPINEQKAEAPGRQEKIMDRPLPKRIGKYDIVRKLGQGGMGIVYQGFDPYNSRNVAVKVALENSAADEESRKRFQKMFFNESRVAGMLEHPNILKVYDAGVDENQYYIVTEFVEGSRTLKDYCSNGTLLPAEKVVEMIFKCCRALDYAHRLGVVHRDIKPTNIMVTVDMDVKIGDFGIAQIIRSDETQTQFNGLMGSPCYMSPEQVKEETLTSQTDLFSLGVVMFELLTAKSPFFSDNIASTVRKILFLDPPPSGFYRSGIPRTLEAIVQKALIKKTSGRYKTAAQFAADLRLTYKDINSVDIDINRKERFNVLRKLGSLSDFQDPELWEVLLAGLWREFGPESIVVDEGALDETFYIIVSGDLTVKKDGKDIAVLKSGDCFGEIGYLTKGKTANAMVATSDTVLLEVNSAIIEQLSPNCQLRFHKVFLKKLLERLSQEPGAMPDAGGLL